MWHACAGGSGETDAAVAETNDSVAEASTD